MGIPGVRTRVFRPAVVLTVAVAVSLCARAATARADAPAKAAPPRVGLAFIYQADKAGADSFKKLLDEAGFVTRLIPIDAVGQTDFSSSAAILAGSDTKGAWGDLAKAIDGTKKPIIGLGYGGSDLFDALRLTIGWGQGWIGPETRVLPVNPSKSPFWSASKVATKEGEPVALYRQSDHIGIYLPKPPADILLIGREPNDKAHYPIVRQGSRYVLWGFTGSPAQMTPAGRTLFVHLCRLTTWAAVPEVPRDGGGGLRLRIGKQQARAVMQLWAVQSWDDIKLRVAKLEADNEALRRELDQLKQELAKLKARLDRGR